MLFRGFSVLIQIDGVCPGKAAGAVDDGGADVGVGAAPACKVELGAGETLANTDDGGMGVGLQTNARGGGAFHDDLSVLNPEIVDLGAAGGIESPLLQGL